MVYVTHTHILPRSSGYPNELRRWRVGEPLIPVGHFPRPRYHVHVCDDTSDVVSGMTNNRRHTATRRVHNEIRQIRLNAWHRSSLIANRFCPFVPEQVWSIGGGGRWRMFTHIFPGNKTDTAINRVHTYREQCLRFDLETAVVTHSIWKHQAAPNLRHHSQWEHVRFRPTLRVSTTWRYLWHIQKTFIPCSLHEPLVDETVEPDDFKLNWKF